jgi:hypothetical protein
VSQSLEEPITTLMSGTRAGVSTLVFMQRLSPRGGGLEVLTGCLQVNRVPTQPQPALPSEVKSIKMTALKANL